MTTLGGRYQRGSRLCSLEKQRLFEYFDFADELDGGLTMDDLDDKFRANAAAAADHFGLPWPPHLATVEEFVLDLRQRKHLV